MIAFRILQQNLLDSDYRFWQEVETDELNWIGVAKYNIWT